MKKIVILLMFVSMVALLFVGCNVDDNEEVTMRRVIVANDSDRAITGVKLEQSYGIQRIESPAPDPTIIAIGSSMELEYAIHNNPTRNGNGKLVIDSYVGGSLSNATIYFNIDVDSTDDVVFTFRKTNAVYAIDITSGATAVQ